MGQYFIPTNLTREEYIYPSDLNSGLKMKEQAYLSSPVVLSVATLLLPRQRWYQTRVVWAGDYMDNEIFLNNYFNTKDINLYHFASNHFNKINLQSVNNIINYYINHTKKQFINLDNIDPSRYDFDPLPLLCSSGNGRGCGDYDDDNGNNQFIGTWAGDIISTNCNILEYSYYTEIIPNF